MMAVDIAGLRWEDPFNLAYREMQDFFFYGSCSLLRSGLHDGSSGNIIFEIVRSTAEEAAELVRQQRSNAHQITLVERQEKPMLSALLLLKVDLEAREPVFRVILGRLVQRPDCADVA